MNKKALIFDFDGTIVNSMDRLVTIAARVMARFFSISPEEAKRLYRLTSGLPFNEQVASLYPDHPQQEKAVTAFETEKRVHYFSEPVFEDALETLHYLKFKNYFLAVSSSNAQELVEAFVAKNKLPFDISLGWKPNFGKGAPHFDFVRKNGGFAAQEMVFIGDSLKDAERALSCQIDFIGKTGTFTSAQFKKEFPRLPTVHTLSQLKEMF